ncbi:ras-related protein Rab-8B-like [Oscarella lobularis]|uniref:ras-related protein Rab-8B-like n=1 Tax=Oscarella lobularis TaxID=121494 RepID=UPI0033135D1F
MAKVDPPSDYVFKILVVGDSGVGKTCLLQRFVDDLAKPSYIATIGIDFKVKTIRIDGDIVKLEIWDTAGQERFRTLTSAYFRGAMGILLVYDVTNGSSFDGIPRWIRSIQEEAPHRTKVLLLGNKKDMYENRCVEKEKGEKVSE